MTDITDKMIELREELIKRQVKEEDRRTAFTIFIKSYQGHKELNGSFRLLKGEEYYKKMKERANYMYEQALKSIGL